jgi:hypothetical protein
MEPFGRIELPEQTTRKQAARSPSAACSDCISRLLLLIDLSLIQVYKWEQQKFH